MLKIKKLLKNSSILFIYLLANNIQSQVTLKELSTSYSGDNSIQVSMIKTNNGYVYSSYISDSVLIADTCFKIINNPYTLIVFTDLNNKILKTYTSNKAIFNPTVNDGNHVIHRIDFNDTVLNINGLTISNTNANNCIALFVTDLDGSNPTLTKIGEYKENQTFSNNLYINSYTINSNNNIVVGGYMRGSTKIGITDFLKDTLISTYIAYEISKTGTLINYNYIFEALNPYFLSNAVKYNDFIYFLSGYDSLQIDNKSFSSLFFEGDKLNDVVLIKFNLNTMLLDKYLAIEDSTSNILAWDDIKINSKGIVFPFRSQVRFFKLNGVRYEENRLHDEVVFYLNKDNLAYKSHFIFQAESIQTRFINVFNDSSFVVSFREPGNFVYVNNTKFNLGIDDYMLFIVLEPNRAPYKILTTKGIGYIIILNTFQPSYTEFFANLYLPTSIVEIKDISFNNEKQAIGWAKKSGYYSMENFSSLKETNIHKVKIYPNPSKGHLSFESNEKINNISLYNLNGQLVGKYLIENNELNLGLYSTGFYTAKIELENGETLFEKLILE